MIFPAWELSMGFVTCSQRSGFSGQMKPLFSWRSSLVLNVGHRRKNYFQGLSTASRILWSSRKRNKAFFASHYWKYWLKICLRPHKFAFSPPHHETTCMSQHPLMLSPFVCSSAVVQEFHPWLLSTTCTLLITSVSVNLWGKSSMLAGFPWDLTVR